MWIHYFHSKNILSTLKRRYIFFVSIFFLFFMLFFRRWWPKDECHSPTKWIHSLVTTFYIEFFLTTKNIYIQYIIHSVGILVGYAWDLCLFASALGVFFWTKCKKKHHFIDIKFFEKFISICHYYNCDCHEFSFCLFFSTFFILFVISSWKDSPVYKSK